MDKFKNFLYYEWKKLVAIAFVIGITAVTFVQCKTRVEADLGILYINNAASKNLTEIKNSFEKEKIAKDATKDDVVSIITREIIIPDDEAIAMEQQVPEQIQIELSLGDCRLFLVSSEVVNTYMTEECFEDIGEIAKKYDIPSDRYLTYSDGRVCAISVEGNTFLESLGFDTRDMYVAQRHCKPEEKKNTLNTNAGSGLMYILSSKQ